MSRIFGVRSLLNLVETRISVADPIACIVDLLRIHWYRARNFFPSRHESALIFYRFGAFDREFPMMPKPVERVKHGLRFSAAHTAATHGIVEHAIAILPWPLLFAVSDVMQYRSVPISSFEWSAHDRPQITRNGRAIDNRSDRGDPDKALRIGITQFRQQRHCPPVRIPLRHWLAVVIAPFELDWRGLLRPRNFSWLLIRRAHSQSGHHSQGRERLNNSSVPHTRENL